MCPSASEVVPETGVNCETKRAAPLTPLAIRNLKAPDSGRIEVPDGATPGLYLRVTAKDLRTWTLRMRGPDGGFRRFVLGKYAAEQGLAWARKEAERLRQGVRREGRDPHRERREKEAARAAEAARERLTLSVLVEDWQRLALAGRSPKYVREVARALKNAFAKQWDAPAENLDRVTVVRTLDQLLRAENDTRPRRGLVRDGNTVWARTAAYGRACFAWAVKRGTIAVNPFAALPVPGRPAERDRVLTDEELVAVWRATQGQGVPETFGKLVRLLILTGQRREEVAGMAWSELSTDRSTWTLPRSRTKNGTPHIVPLSSEARAQLPADEPDPEIRATALVFPGQRNTPFGGWTKAKAALDAVSGVKDWRLHDLRRTFATGLQCLGVRLEVTEAALNHRSGSRAGIVGIYQRHDWATEKRAALDAWAAHVLAALEGKPDGNTGNVIQLRRT